MPARSRETRKHQVSAEGLERLPVVTRLLAELPARRRGRGLARLDEAGRQREGHVAGAVLVLAGEQDLATRRDRDGHGEVPELHEVHVGREPTVRQLAAIAPDGEKAGLERPGRLDDAPPPDAIRAHPRLAPCAMNALHGPERYHASLDLLPHRAMAVRRQTKVELADPRDRLVTRAAETRHTRQRRDARPMSRS